MHQKEETIELSILLQTKSQLVKKGVLVKYANRDETLKNWLSDQQPVYGAVYCIGLITCISRGCAVNHYYYFDRR